ncbi:hypothetical protein DL96DRAFT_1704772 [Flagelloscypha sp. PMI_526]|nr:hypothetical protein DL96DRAFT_1704772 [Flagelloscypha sp. PMI_526]
MPLKTTTDVSDPSAFKNVSEDYLIFFSSIVDGRLWCPDCRAVEPKVKEVFDKPDGPSALLVYVGDKPTWKDKGHILREDPWNVKTVPTVIKKQDGVEVSRLEDDDIGSSKLDELVKSS